MIKNYLSQWLVGLIALFLAVSVESVAMPAKPGTLKFTTPDGKTITVRLRGDEHHHFYTSTDGYVLLRGAANTFTYAMPVGNKLADTRVVATDVTERTPQVRAWLQSIDREACMNVMNRTRAAALQRTQARTAPESERITFPTTGSPKLLAVLVEFQDVKFGETDAKQTFNNYLNQRGYSECGATGSVADWLYDSSGGKFTPEFDVYGPVTLAHEMAYYGENDPEFETDMRAHEMAVEACQLIDDEVNFADYDCDDDGFIDNVYVFYAGYGEHDGGAPETVWPHSWDVLSGAELTYDFDGVRLNHYACSNQYAGGTGTTTVGIGLFCHEFSHVLGLPDLYSVDYHEVFTPGAFTILDSGCYNNDTRTPPLYTGYERYVLGWLEPKVLEGECEAAIKSVSDADGYSDVHLITSNNANQYYILENRQQRGWDQYILGHGLLVWRIYYSAKAWKNNTVNNTTQHVDIIEADNVTDRSDDGAEQTVDGDPFPGVKGVTALSDSTEPSITPISGVKLKKELYDIAEDADGTIRFKFRDNTRSGLSSSTSPVTACTVTDGHIVVTTPAETRVEVLDASGRSVVSVVQPAGSCTYTAPANGIYVVKAGGSVFKLAL